MFGKLYTSDDELTITIAPDQLVIGERVIVNPTREQYLEAGYKEIINNAPKDVPQGYVAIQVGYDEDDEHLIAKYEIIKKTPRPRVFSKYKIIEKAMKMQMWARMKTKLEESGLYDLFLAAQDFREDNEFFKQGIQMVIYTFGMTDDEINEILNECIIES